jgi:hypothetical protein
VIGPRQPAGPRAPGGARSAGARRIAGRTTYPARPARRPSPAAVAQPAAPELDPFEGLSGWQRLMAEFNAFLRDPTLARALAKLARNLTAGVRALARALAQLLSLPWLRRVLLGLLLLALPLALLSLLGSSDDKRAAAPPPPPAAAGAGGFSLPGVAMPELRELSSRPRPVRVALVVAGTYPPATLRRELRTLRTWLSENHARGTRVSVVRSRVAPARTTAAVRSAFGRREGRRLLVTAGTGTASVSRVRGARRRQVAADARRPNALAANVARAIMSASGQRELR